MILSLNGVVRDGSVPGASLAPQYPFAQPIAIPRGEPTTIKLAIIRESGAAQDLSAGSPEVKLSVRKFAHDADDTFTATGSVTSAAEGLVDIPITDANTIDLDELFEYWFDIQLTLSGSRHQVVPRSKLRIDPIVNRPGE